MTTAKKKVIGSASRSVGSNTRRLMSDNSMTYRELSCRLSDLGQPIPILGLRNIISGSRAPTIDEVFAIGKVFGLSISEMIDSNQAAVYRTNVLRWLLAESEFLDGPG